MKAVKPAHLAFLAIPILAAFTVLPAWRVQLFPDFATYGLSRLTLVGIMVALFFCLSPDVDIDLGIGETKPVKTGYGDPLLTLRAMACSIVMIGHGTTVVFPPSDLPHVAADSRSFWLLMPMPWAGVWIFFTLSGYLMGKGFFTGRYHFSRKSIVHFYRNRLLRIVPLYYFALLTAVLFIHPEVLRFETLPYLISTFLFDTEGTRPGTVIGLLWSVATEMQFYLMVPLLALALSKAIPRVGAVAAVAAIMFVGLGYRTAAVFFAVPDDRAWNVEIYSPLLGNLDMFLLGMVTSWTVQRYPLRWPRLGYGFLFSGLIYVASAWWWTAWLPDPRQPTINYAIRYFAPTAFGLATAAAIIMFEHAARQSSDVVSRGVIRATQMLGTLTFAIYIWHEPVFVSLRRLYPSPMTAMDTLSAMALAIPAALLFAWITWLAIEKPFDDRRRFSAR